MKINIAVLFLLIAGFLETSCGTLFIPKTTKVTIKTAGVTASIFNLNDQFVGETPKTLHLSSNVDHIFIIRKAGFEDLPFKIKAKPNQYALTANVLAFCIPCIIDFPKKRYMSLSKKHFDLELFPKTNSEILTDDPKQEINKEVKKINIRASPVKFIAQDSITVSKNEKTVVLDSKNQQNLQESMPFTTEILCSEISDSIVMAHYENATSAKETLPKNQSTFWLETKILNVNFEHFKKGEIVSTTRVEFRFYNQGNNLLLLKTIISTKTSITESYSRALQNSLIEAMAKLKYTKDYYDLIKNEK